MKSTELVTYAGILAAVTGLVGLTIGVRQLVTQARAARLDVLVVINDSWRKRKSTARSESADALPALSARTTHKFISETFARYGAHPIATELPLGSDPVPFGFLAFAPSWATSSAVFVPRNESEYVALLRQRCDASFGLFDSLAAGDGPSVACEAFDGLSKMAERFVSDLNDIAELVESRVMDPVAFLRKRHYAVMREVYVLEPYILWRSTRPGWGRWGMRVLALGASARAFHWTDSYHRTTDVAILSAREQHALRFALSSGLPAEPLAGRARSANALLCRTTQRWRVHRYLSASYREWQNRLLNELANPARP